MFIGSLLVLLPSVSARSGAQAVRFASLDYAVVSAPKKPLNKFLGTWTVVLPNGMKGDTTFRSDGSFFMDVPYPSLAPMVMHFPGKYRQAGNELYSTFTDVQFKNLPAKYRAQMEGSRGDLRKRLEVGVERSVTVKWINSTSFGTTAEGGKPAVYKRKA